MLKRFSISLEDKLCADFDEYIKEKKYANRSEAFRDLIRKVLVRDEWDGDREVVGVINLVYNHHQHQLLEKITEVQHSEHHSIVSTTHIHMDHDNCLEVIIIRGKAGKIKLFAEQLMALKGVKNGDISMSSTGGHLH